MNRTSRILLALPLSFVSLFSLNRQNEAQRLTAPTFYIAASAEYAGSPGIYLRGVSNLPAGAQLTINVYDYVGQGSSVLSQDTLVTLDKGAFFETTVLPKPGVAFRHNLVCDVIFMPAFPTQEESVLRATGRNGSRLSVSGRNPQAKVTSGGYYLQELIHVP
jgi:hypothetical protein